MKKILFALMIILTATLWSCSEKPSIGGEDNGKSPAEETCIDPYVFYEANPRLFATSGQLNAITARLDEIKKLGVNVIWLMPIYELGQDSKSIGSPYCIKDFKKINPEYGTLDDLKKLVNTAHSKDMKVILDWIANHTSWDNDWIGNKGWYTTDNSGNIISPSGWDDVADLNFDNADMREAMTKAMLYWVTETDIDGFRCDYAEGVPSDFWTSTISRLRSEKDGLILLAEANASSLYNCGFDLMYAWGFPNVLQNTINGSGNVETLYNAYNTDRSSTPSGKHRMRYLINHDTASESSAIERFGGKAGALAGFVTATFLAGCPMIYSSQEIGYDKPLSFFSSNKTVLDWTSDTGYTEKYCKIMDAYTSSASIRTSAPKLYETGDAVSICYTNQSDEKLFVIVNARNSTIEVKMPMERVGDRFTDKITGSTTVIPSVLTLEPYQYLILEKK